MLAQLALTPGYLIPRRWRSKPECVAAKFLRVRLVETMQVIPVMRLMRAASLRFVSALLLLPAFSISPLLAQSQAERELQFDGKHRVLAHGIELNGLSKSSDGQRLFVAGEKGEAIVWNLAAGRVEQTLRQLTPVHLIAPLSHPQELVSAGSYHFQPRNAEVRKWNAKTGTSVELQGLDKSSFPTALATEPQSGLIVLTTLEGTIHVWDAVSNAPLATWTIKDVPLDIAVLRRDVYVITVERQSFLSHEQPNESAIIKLNVDQPKIGPATYLSVPERTWSSIDVSPDGRLLKATYEDNNTQTVFIEPISKTELATVPARYAAWIDSSRLVLFDWRTPTDIAQLQSNGPPVMRKLERMDKETNGRAYGVSGLVANVEGSKVWATYAKAGGLIEFDLVTGKTTSLLQTRPGAYSISVDTVNGEDGHMLTGGADGYVRLWKLSNISLLKEYQLRGSDYFVTDALLLPGAKRAVVGLKKIREEREEQQLEPVELVLLDLETGKDKKLAQAFLWRSRVTVVDNQLVIPEGDRIKLMSLDTGQVTKEFRLSDPIVMSAVSANRRWLAAAHETGKVTLLNLTTLTLKTVSIEVRGNAGPMAVTNDGRYMYVMTYDAKLFSWDLNTSQVTESTLTRIREMHTNVDFMTLVNDDKWVVTAGNHADVGVFDRATSRLVSYTRVTSAVFYVERVWVRGDRMILTTDTGALLDGRLK